LGSGIKAFLFPPSFFRRKIDTPFQTKIADFFRTTRFLREAGSKLFFSAPFFFQRKIATLFRLKLPTFSAPTKFTTTKVEFSETTWLMTGL